MDTDLREKTEPEIRHKGTGEKETHKYIKTSWVLALGYNKCHCPLCEACEEGAETRSWQDCTQIHLYIT